MKVSSNFNKNTRITVIVGPLIAITILLLPLAISPPVAAQSGIHYGLNNADIRYLSSHAGETLSPRRQGKKITGHTFKPVASYSDSSDHRSSFVTVGGLRVHYLDWGGRGPAMFFVPGAGNTAHVFDDFAPRFVDDYRVVAITRVGFGESEMPSGMGYSLAERVAHIRALLNSLDLTEVVLVGHSLGGDEITEFAVKHPDRVNAVIYLDAAYDHILTGQWQSTLATSFDARPPAPTAGDNESVQAFQRYLASVHGVTLPVGEVLASFRFDSAGVFKERRSPPRVMQEIMAATEPPNFAGVRAPVLAIYSDFQIPQDFAPWLPDASSALSEELLRQVATERERVEALIPKLTVVLRRNHHYQFLTEPDWTESTIRSFLEE
ncbi:alpha/beta fold hydrolase [Cyclobacterium salsum]|uniref:alpha/beta fold hydrolase n=1 Tax=Cyclobacterium salsum TaxID=2666329 RepID=UPI001390C7E7|nr:alpha/beta hydrolase [Cyclobacterium salsum]